MREALLELAKSSQFSGLLELDEKVIKLNHLYGKNKISTIYLDYSQNFLSPQDALLKQEKIVGNEYFKVKGSLQWNFYYYYIFDDPRYESQENQVFSKNVESDTDFSRKRVLTLEKLKNHYPFATVFELVEASSSSFRDLSSEWIGLLRESGLIEVYSDSTYDASVERYLSGTCINEENNNDVRTEDLSSHSLAELKNIELKQYRSFTPGSKFEFGKVNLIEGVNGVGKTSLLEAIELAICGKTYRHEKSESAEIVLRTLASEEKYPPRNIKKFQDRESFWYGIPSVNNRNNLFKSFNRFTFFNTDASYRFSMGDEPKEIWNSFLALALGGKTAELSKRIEGFETRFKTALTRLEKEKNSIENERDKIQLNKEIVDKNIILKVFNFESLKEALSKIDSQLIFDIDKEDDLVGCQNTLERFRIQMKLLLDSIQSDDVVTRESLESRFLTNKETIKNIKNLDADVLNLKKLIREVNQQKDEVGKNIFLRKRLASYLSTPEAFEILSLEKNFAESNSQINFLHVMINSIKDEDLIGADDDGKSLTTLLEQVAASKKRIGLESEKIDIRIKSSRDTLESFKSIILEIKALGRKYLQLTPLSSCPLCGTDFERSELEEKISAIEVSAADYAEDLELRSKLAQENKSLENKLLSLRRLCSAIDQIDPLRELSLVKVEEVKEYIKNEINSLSTLLSKKDEIKKKLDFLDLQGYSSKELVELKRELEFASFEERGNVSSDNDVNLLLLESSLADITQKIEFLRKDFKEKTNNFLNKYPRFEVDLNMEGSESLFLNYSDLIQFNAGYEAFVADFPRIDRREDLKTLVINSSVMKEELTNYLGYLSNKKQQSLLSQQAEEQHKALKEKLELVTRRFNLATKAVDCFENIRLNHSKEMAVSSFFNQNKKLIIEIFKELHSPNEFESIEIIDEKIYVLKKDGSSRELSMVSTGQRTAIALSFFFGMHLSCPQAPKIILFDDPIAFIDDLNILAFLDFLREIVIRGDRQIFFATANQKLANLFKRKFEILGDKAIQNISPQCNH